MNALDHIQLVRHQVNPTRRHYVDEDDVKIVLSRLPGELWARLRKVYLKDDARGNRRFGYTTTRGRREVTLCALPYQITISPRTMGGEEFGAVRGSPWPTLAVRRYLLYNTLLHEIGHLQIVLPKSKSPNRKFASETLAQEFADTWRRRIWSERFDHPDPVHNPPSEEELRQLNSGWIEANLAYKRGHGLYKAKKYQDAAPHLRRAIELYPDHALALERLGIITLYGLAEAHGRTTDIERRDREATALLRRAVQVDPTLPDANLFLAMSLGRAGKPQISRRFFARAIRLDPCPGVARSQFANLLSYWGCSTEAVTLFKTLIKANPENALALAGYARHLLFRSDDDSLKSTRKAVDLLERAVRIQRKNGSYHHLLGLALQRVGGRSKDAEHHLREALRLDPTNDEPGELLKDLATVQDAGGDAYDARGEGNDTCIPDGPHQTALHRL